MGLNKVGTLLFIQNAFSKTLRLNQVTCFYNYQWGYYLKECMYHHLTTFYTSLLNKLVCLTLQFLPLCRAYDYIFPLVQLFNPVCIIGSQGGRLTLNLSTSFSTRSLKTFKEWGTEPGGLNSDSLARPECKTGSTEVLPFFLTGLEIT